MNNKLESARALRFLFIIVGVVIFWSLIQPHDVFTWFLEAFPVLIALPLLAITYSSFQFTPLIYSLIAIHCCVLLVGAHYTYAQVPLFTMIEPIFGFTRNHYDRLGHFAQGFVPAMIAREILTRRGVVLKPKWRFFIIIFICMALSAWYELLEWRVSVATGSAADAFLGTQGDPWDTQEDMFMAFIGATVALLTLSGWHDRQLQQTDSGLSV